MSEPFRPLGHHELEDELGIDEPDDAELSSALATGKDLERIAMEPTLRPSADFEDRVWAAIAAEPLPAPATAAGSAVRKRSPRAFLVALLDARRVAFGGGRPPQARGRALALLLAAALVLAAVGGAAVAGAAALFAPAPGPTNIATPSPTPPPSVTLLPSLRPSPSESESPGPGASESAGDTESPAASGESPGGAGSTEPAESPGSSGEPESSARPSPGASATPEPTPTPE